MPRIINDREKFISFLTVGVVIFYLVFNFLISPALSKNDILNKETKITTAKLKTYLRLLDQKEYLQKKYSEFSQQGALQGGERPSGGLSDLENLARNSNIHIIDIRPKSSVKTSSLYKEELVDLRTEGAMEGYLKFIYSVENSLSLLRIKKFQLSAKPNSQSLEGNFSISQIFISE